MSNLTAIKNKQIIVTKVNLNGGNIGDIKFQAKLLINSKQRLENKNWIATIANIVIAMEG
jgi:hypothetical protein